MPPGLLVEFFAAFAVFRKPAKVGTGPELNFNLLPPDPFAPDFSTMSCPRAAASWNVRRDRSLVVAWSAANAACPWAPARPRQGAGRRGGSHRPRLAVPSGAVLAFALPLGLLLLVSAIWPRAACSRNAASGRRPG